MVASTLLGNQTVRVLPPSPANKRHPTAPAPYSLTGLLPKFCAAKHTTRSAMCGAWASACGKWCMARYGSVAEVALTTAL